MKKLLWIALSIGLSIQFLSATSTQPLTSGKAIDGDVKQKEKKYYNITVPKNKSVRVNLTELEADIDLYIKKGNEVRLRFNDCYSSNSNTENEECVVSNEGESSIYTIMVNGFKQSAFTLKATVDGSEEIPTLSSDPLADAIEKKEGKQYRVEGKKGETITVTLSDLTADADLRVRVGRKAGLHSFNCKSNNSGTKTEECVITPKKDATVYVHVYGYQASNYSLKAVKGNVSTPCITLENLKAKIKNNEDVTKVNTSCITNMSRLFTNNQSFNQDISKWDVSNVRDMSHMFDYATSFNQDISKWDVSNVTNMSGMFLWATAFNQDISNWDVSNVTNMKLMFNIARSFNQPIGNWDVSNVTNMHYMLGHSKFNQPLNNWNVSNVTDMSGMFNKNIAFNQDISNWDVSNVINMDYMFDGAESFNQDITNWDVSKVDFHYSFFYPDKGKNKEPNWQNEENLITLAKEHCLKNNKNTKRILCSSNENRVYIFEPGQSTYDTLAAISTNGDWSIVNRTKLIDGFFAIYATSLNSLKNTNLFYVNDTDPKSNSYFNFYYFVDGNIKQVLHIEIDKSQYKIDVLRTIENGKKLLIEYHHKESGKKTIKQYDIKNLPTITLL